jgi:ParB family chromosome partitioning protein
MNPLFNMEAIPVQESKSQEWYTPPDIIEAARKVMDSIELDPASCDMANQTVRAARIYTKEQNGLAQPWAGPLWMNPPFGKGCGSLDQWVGKLLEEHAAGNVAQATILVPVSVHTPWFQALLETAAICFAYRRVRFIRPFEKESQSNLYGNVFAYLGLNVSRFVEHFTEFGPVVTPDGVHRRPAPVPQPTLWDTQELVS